MALVRPLAALAALVLVPAAEASVREKLRAELKPVIDAIRQTARDENQATVAVGEFARPPQAKAGVGPGIEQLLLEELEIAQPGFVNRASPLSATGSLKLIEEAGQTFVRLVVKLELTSGKELGEARRDLRDSEVVAFLLGLTVHLPPGDTRDDLQRRIGEARNNQKPDARNLPFVLRNDNKQLATSAASPFAVEVLVTKVAQAPKDVAAWKALPARQLVVKEGHPAVAADQGEVYALRIVNKAAHEAAITVAIDGVDVFQLAERNPGERPPFSHYVVPAGGEVLITGWFLNLEKVSSFLVTGAGEGVVTKLGQPRGKVGTISVTFAAAWEGDNVPPDEKGRRGAASETGQGPTSEARAKPVKRNIGVVRDVLTLVYDR